MIDFEAYIENRIKELAEPMTSDDLEHRIPQDGRHAIIKRRRGRPSASESGNEQTKASYDASVFYLAERKLFWERMGRRMPTLVRKELLALAQELWPDMSEDIVGERIRTNKRQRVKK